MEKYTTTIKKEKIIFKDLINNIELEINHYDEDYIHDTIFINKNYDSDFIEYIIKKLKEANDINVLFVEFDSPNIEKLLKKYGLKVSNYQYQIKYSKSTELEGYDISDTLDDEVKDLYLNQINTYGYSNYKYLHPNGQYQEYGERWFHIEDYKYRIYKKMGKVVGIVDYKIFEDDSSYSEVSHKCFDYRNKLCIRCLFSEDIKVLEDIIHDLLNIYKKNIIINITYSEKKLRDVVKMFPNEFEFCQYIFTNDK